MVTPDNGLSSGKISCLYKDDAGFLYIGSYTGIDRFNGSFVENIPFPNTSNGKLQWIRDMIDVGHDKLLVGNTNGLWLLDKQSLKYKHLEEKTIDCEVTSFAKASDSTLYIGTVRGLYRMRMQPNMKVEPLDISNPQVSEPEVSTVRLWKKGGKTTVWVSLKHGVLRYVPNGKSVYYGCKTNPNVLVKKMAIGPDGQVFVGTEKNGVMRLDLQQRALVTWALRNNKINDIQTSGNHLLVATELYGCFEIDSRTGKILHTYNNSGNIDNTFIRFDSPRVFYRDNHGVNWFGYPFFGIDYTYYSRNIFHVFKCPHLIDSADWQVRNFLMDGHRLLLCTRQGLLIVDQSTRDIHFLGPEKLGVPLITQALRYGNRYYVATIHGGVKIIDATSLDLVTPPAFDVLNGCNVYNMVNDGKGSIWFASSAGIFRYLPSKQEGQLYNTQNSQLPDNEVYCLAFDHSGMGWVSTKGGICNIFPESNTISVKNVPDIINSLGALNSIENDGAVINFLPQGGFPVIYNSVEGKLKRVRLPIFNEFPCSYYLHHIKGNTYLYATDDGIFLGDSTNFRQFGLMDGLPTRILQSRNMRIDENGVFWAATNEGLVYAKISDMMKSKYPHIPIMLVEAQTDHWMQTPELNKVNMDKVLKLSRTSNEMSVKFTPLLFANTTGIRYRYKLEGLDEDWHLAQTNNTIFYHGLKPGNYLLHIEALGMPEINSTFTVKAYVMWSTMVEVLLSLAILALISHVVYCRWKKVPYFWDKFLPKPEKYQKSKVNRADGERLTETLKEYMEKEKPYLNPNLQMSDVAEAIGCTTHVLSQIFSVYLQRSYYDFIAEYRVREFQNLATNPKYAKYTITALSELCGFRSRTPFLTAFKKFVGRSPKDFIKSIK
ncbi:MAG: triple tyrosine motif-containing protein [Prevotella sp.]